MGKNSLVDKLKAAYEKGRRKGYEEGVFATHAVWIGVIENTPGIGPKTREKFQASAAAMMKARYEAKGIGADKNDIPK